LNPYFIPGPAAVSFSGGRTSAYMLFKILEAHGGTLPEDVLVCFNNTGKEREQTLRFVHECATRWGAHVHWLEYREGGNFEEVGYNSADRRGGPFETIVRERMYLPNAVSRFCTIELKVRTTQRYLESLGWERWSSVVGFRYDEGHRVLKALARNESNKERFKAVMPLAKAKATKRTVMEFWKRQDFDLQLLPYEGNCDLCFLKSKRKLVNLIRENPGMATWWAAQEASVTPDKPTGARFVTEYSYADLERLVRDQGHFDFGEADEEHDVECGEYCAA
jgi:3'-phosphoadenosine 5'-phosphosulfate sulfotransferase (PAPS reductase)/FAD synthetase